MEQIIMCEVDSCKFNREGSRCGAEKIFVGAHKGHADSSDETDCKTFEHV
ncbi:MULTISPECIES: DUF1540 domain-containing protein [Jeotgalibacillus]|nr:MULTISPECIES: DUF1540 domain-containing protein [Jeotgalibacillus]TFD95861.1 DUF1540 domain-containing protein [Jeotgalibacillus sp. R-1-5s-1]